MVCPPTPRETEVDDIDFRSNDDGDSIIPSTTGNNDDSDCISSESSGSATSRSSALRDRRTKRVASMSIGSDDHQHPYFGAHGLPPLPPLATNTTKSQRSSFFCAPSLHDSASDNSSSGSSSSRDSTARKPSQPQPLSNDSTSSLSSTLTSTSATATIPLSRPSSPPEQHQYQQSLVGSFAHGMPFSNMLDLATAKAENITGLYFAKQMNLPSVQVGAGGAQDMLAPLQGSGGCADEKEEEGMKRARAVTSTGSSTMDISGAATASTDTRMDAVPPMLALDGVQLPGSSLTAPISTTPTPPTPTKSQHRRSHSASHFFHLSSLKHHSPAQFNLALCYEHGQGGVEQDLIKALHFYQQAADQGHTKASYNLGCICYNQGEISKAMAWFESAGKCGVQGLKTDTGVLPSASSVPSTVGSRKPNGPMVECPMPKAIMLPHELEDMLMMGDYPSGPDGTGGAAGVGGPFVAYLPAILCLALLCRQGVQTREGEVILKRDPDQAVALLQRLLERAPARLLNRLEKGHHHQQHHQASTATSSSGDSKMGAGKRDPRKRASLQAVPTHQQGATVAASIFSTSCPQLPLGISSSLSSSSSSSASTALTGSRTRIKRPSTVEDAIDDDDDVKKAFYLGGSRSGCESHTSSTTPSGPRRRFFLDSEQEEEGEEALHGSDVHEAWSVTLAQQLLKAWQQPGPSVQGRSTSTSASLEDGRVQQRIVRHHLLYITNPTLGKNFYNLGVLYDLYLGHGQIAERCYRSAYQSCQPCLLPTRVPVQDAFGQDGAGPSKQQHQKQLAGLVTRINSAWNLGVLHAKHQEWHRARSWFLKAQRDVLAHERIVESRVESVVPQAQKGGQNRGREDRVGGGEAGIVSDLAALLMKGNSDDGCEGDWSSKAEKLLSLGGSTKKGVNVGEDDTKTRRRSLVNVLPTTSTTTRSTSNSKDSRGERRGRNGGRHSGREDPPSVPQDNPGSRHAREHGLMMHLTASSSSSSVSSTMSGSTTGAVKSKKTSLSSLSSRVGESAGGGGSDGIRTDASKIAWVLRWVESNMESSSVSSSWGTLFA
ncbi:hypothetical protein BGX29_009957 [Mortierella sp. GBA35]|nr:hypothetical protein BGX29_009957 [Mortierella sp. GBA35]